MSNLPWKKLGIAALIAGGAQLAALSGASATTLPVTQGTAPQVSHQDGNVIQVGKKYKHRHYRDWNEYRRYRGGHRYRARRAGYVYFYNGYYYATPWWTVTVPLPVVPLVPVIPGVTIQIN